MTRLYKKITLIAATHVDSFFKVKRLKWWNDGLLLLFVLEKKDVKDFF